MRCSQDYGFDVCLDRFVSGATTNAIGCVPEWDYKKAGTPFSEMPINIAMFYTERPRLRQENTPPVDCPCFAVEKR